MGSAQPWPAWMVNPVAADAANLSTSAPANAMLGDLPPSSSKTFFTLCAAWPMIRFPTASEPVKLTMSTPGWVVRCSLASTSPVMMLSTPGGSPASSAISPSTIASSGVNGDGLSTTVLPTASAGTTLTRFRYSGKLNGVIAATTPMGSFRITPWPRPRGSTGVATGRGTGSSRRGSANHDAYRNGVSNWSACANMRACNPLRR